MKLAKSNSGNLGYKMSLDLSGAISQLQALEKQMKKIFGSSLKNGVMNIKVNLNTTQAKKAIESLKGLTITPTVKLNTSSLKGQMKSAMSNVPVTPVAGTSGQGGAVNSYNMAQAFRSTIAESQRQMYQGQLHNVTGSAAAYTNYQRFSAYRNTTQPPTTNVGARSFDMYNQNYMVKREMEKLSQAISKANTNTGSVRTNQLRGMLGMGGYSPQMWQQYNQMVKTSDRPSTTSPYRTYDSPQMIEKSNRLDRTYYNRYVNRQAATPYAPGVTQTSRYDPRTANLTRQGMLTSQKQSGRNYNLTEMMDMYILSSSLQNIGYGLRNTFDTLNQSFEQIAPSFRKTQVVTGMNDDMMRTYKQDMYNLTSETMTPLSTLGEMGYSFATRGYMDPKTAAESLEPLAISSLIAGESPVQMGKSVMSLMQAWNPMQMGQLEQRAPGMIREYSDLMTYAYSSSPLETRWFKDIANYAAPVFSGLGFEPNETMSTFMAMSQMIPTPGIGARSARMAVSNLFDLNKLNKVSEDYGIDLGGDIEKIRQEGGGLADIFQQLGERIKSLPDNQQNTFMRTIGGGVRGGMALQALLPVIGNIEEYQTKIEAEAEGYTALAQEEYQSKPLGRLRMAESEREALTYQLGEKGVGARTAYMKLENAILKLVNKLPEWTVAAGYGAGKGLEAVAGITQQGTNIGMLQMVSQNLKKMGGFWGGFSTAALGASIAVPLATAAGTAISAAYEKEQGREAGERKEELEGKNVFQQGDLMLGEWRLVPKQMTGVNRLDYPGDQSTQYSYGSNSSEETANMVLQTTNMGTMDINGKTYTALRRGEVSEGSDFKEDIDRVNKLWGNSLNTIKTMLPKHWEDDKADKFMNKLSMLSSFGAGQGQYSPASMLENLKTSIKTGNLSFGEVSKFDSDNKKESYEQIAADSLENLDKAFQNMTFGEEMRSFQKNNTDLLGDQKGMFFRAMGYQLVPGQGDSNLGKLSDKDIKSFVSGYMEDRGNAIFADIPGGQDKAATYYTEMLMQTRDILSKTGDLTQIVESIENQTDSGPTTPDSYTQMIAAWMRGDLKGDTLPGPDGMADMVYGYSKGDRANSMMVAFGNQAGPMGRSGFMGYPEFPKEEIDWNKTYVGNVMGAVSSDFLTQAERTGGGVSNLERDFYNKYKTDIEGLTHSMNIRTEGTGPTSYGP